MQTRLHNAVNEIDNNTSDGDAPSGTITGGAWAQPEYDKAGNMDVMPQPKAPTVSFTAKYDAWNRLTQLTGFPLGTATFQYDGLGRRIVRDEGGAVTRYFYNERWQVLTEANAAGTPTAVYLYHPHSIDALAVRMTSAAYAAGAGEHFFTHDALFSVTAAVAKSTGQVAERYAYAAYGVPRVMDAAYNARTASAIANETGYTGRQVDPQSGLQLNRYRYYHTQIGRWVNRDPIGYAAGDINLYNYVDSNPLVYVDPTGNGKIGFCIKTVKGLWKRVTPKQARDALSRDKDVLIEGPGSAKDAKNLGAQQWGDKNVRHDPHAPGQMPHYQHKNGGGTHIFYRGLGGLTAVGWVGDNAVGNTLDLFNPVSDIKDIVDLFGDDEEPADCPAQE